MNTLRRFAYLAAVAAVLLALAAAPALATEGGGEAGGGEPAKIQLPDSPRDQVGLILLGLSGLAVVAAGANALQQLRGRRPTTSGEWRWR